MAMVTDDECRLDFVSLVEVFHLVKLNKFIGFGAPASKLNFVAFFNTQ